MFEHEKKLGAKRESSSRRSQGPLRRVRRREKKPLYRPHLFPHPPGIPESSPPRRRGVRIRPRHGHHSSLRRSRLSLSNFHAHVTMWKTGFLSVRERKETAGGFSSLSSGSSIMLAVIRAALDSEENECALIGFFDRDINL